MKNALPCFRCKKELEQVLPDESDRNQPYNAVTFTTSGQYGSTVFDEFDGSKLAINICDDCLVRGRADVLHVEGYPERKWKPWVPDHDPLPAEAAD